MHAPYVIFILIVVRQNDSARTYSVVHRSSVARTHGRTDSGAVSNIITLERMANTVLKQIRYSKGQDSKSIPAAPFPLLSYKR